MSKMGMAALCALAFAAAPAGAATITVQGDVTSVGNCIPFGCPGEYGPTMGFVYQNIAAFGLLPGDTIAFDTGDVNDIPLDLVIELAAATSNGSNIADGAGFTQVAGGNPSNPFGNTVVGDFDLVWTVTTAFNFSGGGLIIRFSPQGASAGDFSFEQNLVHSHASDPSGLFVGRWYNDNDGLFPYGDGPDSGFDGTQVGHFQIVASLEGEPAPVPEPSSLLMLGAGALGLAGVARRRRRS